MAAIVNYLVVTDQASCFDKATCGWEIPSVEAASPQVLRRTVPALRLMLMAALWSRSRVRSHREIPMVSCVDLISGMSALKASCSTTLTGRYNAPENLRIDVEVAVVVRLKIQRAEGQGGARGMWLGTPGGGAGSDGAERRLGGAGPRLPGGADRKIASLQGRTDRKASARPRQRSK